MGVTRTMAAVVLRKVPRISRENVDQENDHIGVVGHGYHGRRNALGIISRTRNQPKRLAPEMRNMMTAVPTADL